MAAEVNVEGGISSNQSRHGPEEEEEDDSIHNMINNGISDLIDDGPQTEAGIFNFSPQMLRVAQPDLTPGSIYSEFVQDR